MVVTEDDQVRQVRAGQKQRPSIGKEQTAIKKRRFAPAPAPGGVDEHRGEEGHRGVQVQHGRDDSDHDRGSDKKRRAAAGDAGELVPGSSKQAVIVDDQADEQKPGHEHER